MEKMEFDEGKQQQQQQEAEDITSYVEEVKQVEEVLYDPVDEIVVEDCCPAVCYVRSAHKLIRRFRPNKALLASSIMAELCCGGRRRGGCNISVDFYFLS